MEERDLSRFPENHCAAECSVFCKLQCDSADSFPEVALVGTHGFAFMFPNNSDIEVGERNALCCEHVLSQIVFESEYWLLGSPRCITVGNFKPVKKSVHILEQSLRRLLPPRSSDWCEWSSTCFPRRKFQLRTVSVVV
jgi:hypothetical protein